MTIINQHISKQYDNELENIRSQVLAMGGLVEQQLNSSITALIESDNEVAESVIKSEYNVNRYEVAIDEECTRILAKRQPAAVDGGLVKPGQRGGEGRTRCGQGGEPLGQGPAPRRRLERDREHVGEPVAPFQMAVDRRLPQPLQCGGREVGRHKRIAIAITSHP